jgi:hypothetical protein
MTPTSYMWSMDDFVDAAGNAPPEHHDIDLTGFKLKPEAAARIRAGWTAEGYTPEVIDDILARDPVSADTFLDRINAAVRKQRALRHGANA